MRVIGGADRRLGAAESLGSTAEQSQMIISLNSSQSVYTGEESLLEASARPPGRPSATAGPEIPRTVALDPTTQGDNDLLDGLNSIDDSDILDDALDNTDNAGTPDSLGGSPDTAKAGDVLDMAL